MRILALLALAVGGLFGCAPSDDEGGVSTATPASELHRPPPEETAGAPTASTGAGVLPGGK